MSKAAIKPVEHKREKYLAQNKGRTLTAAQKRQLRKTKTRLDAKEDQ